MSGEREHTFTDPENERMRICPSGEYPASAFLADLTETGIRVPAHRLAEFTRAIYAAAGQVVPDLPVIYDPAHVEALERDLFHAIEGISAVKVTGTEYERYARTLLSLGWRKP